MRSLIFFTSLLVSAACFAPHYTNWVGLKSDLSVKQQQAVRTLPEKAIYGWPPTKQIDAIRSWLEYGPGKAAFPKRSSLLDSVNCVTAIADELRINVKSYVFRKSMKEYNWNSPVNNRTTGSDFNPSKPSKYH